MTTESRMPNVYQRAEWRCTTPVDEATRQIGIAFNLEDGRVIRVQLGLSSACQLMNSLRDYMGLRGESRPEVWRRIRQQNSYIYRMQRDRLKAHRKQQAIIDALWKRLREARAAKDEKQERYCECPNCGSDFYLRPDGSWLPGIID